eukprot:c20871_g1_i1.p2 GENE.c20871_g1_i1~~c20871_g1_i1.p2  ORF type:complete len:425 (-),score=69.43 c20871_g1_i1:13-1287(-)
MAPNNAVAESLAAGLATPPRDEMIIDDRVYDITEFMKRHPGGSVIKYQAGRDGTALFETFHDRSSKARAVLKSLPSRPVEKDDMRRDTSPVTKDFLALRRELEAEGYFDASYPHLVWRLVQLALMTGLALWLMLARGWVLLGAVVLGVMQAQSGWLQHEFGHYSGTGDVRIDRHFHLWSFGLLSSMSAAWWRRNHNKHHAAPQQLAHDVDLNTLPFVAFAKEMLPRGLPNLWLRFQAFHFLPMLEGLALYWSFLIMPLDALKRGDYAELAVMSLNHIYRLALGYIAGGGSLSTMAAVYLLVQTTQAMYLFGHFSLSHTHHQVLGADESLNMVEQTLRTTTNIEASWWCNWIMGNLNQQIEHHLFPSMPQFRHPQIQDRVRALARKHGLPYHCVSYLTAWRMMFANLWDVGHASAPLVSKRHLDS